jgi:hypothetical protein
MDNNTTLGGRLPLLDPEELEGDQKKLYELLDSTLISWADASGFKGKTDDVKLIGPFNPFLYSTGITPGFLQWMQAESKHTSLDKRVHEVVFLSTGAVWQSPSNCMLIQPLRAKRAFPRLLFKRWSVANRPKTSLRKNRSPTASRVSSRPSTTSMRISIARLSQCLAERVL